MIFTVTYAGVTWPALAQAWWYTDDLVFADPGCSVQQMLRQPRANGRLVQGLWLLTYLPEQGPDAAGWNRAWRGLQVVFHAGAATLMAAMFWRAAPGVGAILATLPFLLWGLSGEAVLWRCAGIYPLGALLAMSGLAIIHLRPRRLVSGLPVTMLGVLLCAAAPLSSQSAALAPAAVLAIVLAVRLVRAESERLPRLLGGGALVAFGLALGAAVSIWVGREGGRMGGSDWSEKLAYLVRLNESVIAFPGVYHPLHAAEQVLLVMTPVLLLTARVARAPGLAPLPWRAGLLALGALASPFVVLHAAALASSEHWGSLRVLYLGPLAIGGCWLAVREMLRGRRAGEIGAYVLLGLIVVQHVLILHRYAGDRVRLFEADRRVVADLAAAAQEHGARGVYVLTHPNLRVSTWNPHEAAVGHLDASYSSLQISWSADEFVQRFSELEPIRAPGLRERARELCNSRRPPIGFDVFYLPEFDAMCLCPP